jgi:hypothetical protein
LRGERGSIHAFDKELAAVSSGNFDCKRSIFICARVFHAGWLFPAFKFALISQARFPPFPGDAHGDESRLRARLPNGEKGRRYRPIRWRSPRRIREANRKAKQKWEA